MAYLPRTVVEKSIRTRVRKDRNGNEHTDYEAYLGIDPFNGKPIRITRSDTKKLNKALSDFYIRHRIGGDTAVHLSAVQAIDAKNAYDALASAGFGETSLYQAVSAYIGGIGVNKNAIDMTIYDAFDKYFQSKFDIKLENGKLPSCYKTMDISYNARTIYYVLGKWVNTCATKKISTVTTKDVVAYLEDQLSKSPPKTYNQHILYLKTFFNWCCKETIGILHKSPVSSIPYKPVPWREPKYMKVEDVEKLFRLFESKKESNPEYLAYIITNFFCGCRAVEVRRMATDPDACKVNIEGETVRIAKGKGYQRGKRPRAFQIHPTGLAWIKSFDFTKGIDKIEYATVHKLYRIARKNGIPVFSNCGRHTFITYHVAAYGNPLVTQAMVGTGGRMMAENYCGLAIKKDGEAYFNILPK